jgi:Protein of unknown function (DUF2933)
METRQSSGVKGWLFSRMGPILFAFFAIAAFFLITEHRAHLFGILPYLLLLACPLLHLFMHRGHGGHGGGSGDGSDAREENHEGGHR